MKNACGIMLSEKNKNSDPVKIMYACGQVTHTILVLDLGFLSVFTTSWLWPWMNCLKTPLSLSLHFCSGDSHRQHTRQL